MKQNDVAAIVLIVAISAVISYFVANAVIGQPKNNPVQVEQVTAIGATFPTPDPRIFNDKAIDPTVKINGTGQATDRPFTN